jgi:HTH-type transcriptional regulator / antitoxin HigA
MRQYFPETIGLYWKGSRKTACVLLMWRTTMVTKTEVYPDMAIHPGEYLAEEIEARGISQKELAERMGRPLNAINEIINGKKAITAETALQLEEVMPEIPARFWLNLETDYQLTKALISKRTKNA